MYNIQKLHKNLEIYSKIGYLYLSVLQEQSSKRD